MPCGKALAATVERQLSTGFETTVFEMAFDISTQYYLSYDWGETWQNLSTHHNAMINSADGGVRARVTRYVEVDFEGLNRCNRFPNGGTILALGSRRCSVFYWRVLVRFGRREHRYRADARGNGGGTWRRPRATIR